jgi:hypothetical protein
MTYPVVFHATRAIPMDPRIEGWYPGDGDPWHYLWAFWYFKRALLASPPNPFWTDLVFYPIGFDMPFVTGVGAILLPAAALAPALGLTLTYNVLWIASFVLAGYATYRLVDHLLRDQLIAFLSGHLFMFSSYRLLHGREHLPLLLASFLVPLFALCLFRAAARPGTATYVPCALVWGVSAGVSWYATIALSIYLGPFLLVETARRARNALGASWPGAAVLRQLRSLAIAGVVAIATASAFVLPMVISRAAHDGILDRSLDESNAYSADLLAFFVPSPTNPVFGRLTAPLYRRFSGNPYEQTVYLGFVLLGLAVWGVRVAPAPKRRLLTLTAAVFFVLALGPFLHVAGRSLALPLPYLLLWHVPFVNGMRVPSRFVELLVFALTLLAAYGLSALSARLGRPQRVVLVCALGAAAAVELASLPYPVMSTRVPEIYRRIAATPGDFTVLELPLDWHIIRPHYDQAVHGKRLLVGHPVRSRDKYSEYPAGVPLAPWLKDPRRLLDGAPPDAHRDAQRFVDFFDVRYVVLHRAYLEPRVFEALDRFVADHFPHGDRWADDDVVAYSLKAPPAPATLWPRDYVVDFGSNREFVLLSGWSGDERIGDTTMQWSKGPASSMFVYLEALGDRVLELRLRPLTYARGPTQAVRVDVNGRPQARLLLTPGWGEYRVPIPSEALRRGLNRVTFTYRYTAAPADVIPGNADPRKLAVAFDYAALRRRP